jgi:hypothetical protein
MQIYIIELSDDETVVDQSIYMSKSNYYYYCKNEMLHYLFIRYK